MNTMALYDRMCAQVCRSVVARYSTSFSRGIRALGPTLRPDIAAIYAFVRIADEVVDTFHALPQGALLDRFRADTRRAISERVSLNPVLHSFQRAVHANGIELALIEAFLDSMAMDLERSSHDATSFGQYIHGSAEAVGLMCLHVFCQGDLLLFPRLRPAAMRLGAAFQKVNFLRDLHDDQVSLGRTYFPGLETSIWDDSAKRQIERDAEADLKAAWPGIKALPRSARFGVHVAFLHHRALLRKIQGLTAAQMMQERIRIGWPARARLLATGYIRHRLGPA